MGKIETLGNVGFDGREDQHGERGNGSGCGRGRRAERVESGTRQTCLAITEKLKCSRQPPLFQSFPQILLGHRALTLTAAQSRAIP